MKYTSVNKIRNPYPADELGIFKSDTISTKNNDFVLEGKYIDNVIRIPFIKPFDKLNIADGVSFRFIVEFNPNNLWTSRLFYDELKAAYEEKNPYFNLITVPTVKLDYNFLQNYKNKNGFEITERYCEVEVLDTIDTEQKMCDHIDWLVNKDADSIELRPTSILGKWIVKKDGSFGLGAKDEYDFMKKGDIDSEAYGAEIILEKYDLTLPQLAKVEINQPSPINLNPVEELVRIMANIPTPNGKELYKPLGGGLGVALGLVGATVLTIVTGGIGALSFAAFLGGVGGVAATLALGALAGKQIGDVLGKNYSAEGKYWNFITQRTTTRDFLQAATTVVKEEASADTIDWKQLLIETGKQMKVSYSVSDVQSALDVLLGLKATNNPSNQGDVRPSDLSYRIEVGNVVRFFKPIATSKFDVRISY
jgi:hypothetical protein